MTQTLPPWKILKRVSSDPIASQRRVIGSQPHSCRISRPSFHEPYGVPSVPPRGPLLRFEGFLECGPHPMLDNNWFFHPTGEKTPQIDSKRRTFSTLWVKSPSSRSGLFPPSRNEQM